PLEGGPEAITHLVVVLLHPAEEEPGGEAGHRRAVTPRLTRLGDDGAVAIGLDAVAPAGSALLGVERELTARVGRHHLVHGGPAHPAPSVESDKPGAHLGPAGLAEPAPAGALRAQPSHLGHGRDAAVAGLRRG